MTEYSQFAAAAAELLIAYWLHSTVAIVLTWLATRGRESSTLHERLWKYAAVVGLISAPAQVFLVPRAASALRSDGASSDVASAARLVDHSESTLGVRQIPLQDDASQGTSVADAVERMASPAVVVRSATPDDSPIAAPDALPVGGLAAEEALDVGRQSEASESHEEIANRAEATATSMQTADSRSVEATAIESPPPKLQETRATGRGWLGAVGFALAPLPAICVLLGMMLILVRAHALRRRIGAAKPLRGRAERELRRLLRSRGITRSVRLLCSEHYAEPVAVGSLNWTIILPAGIEKRLSAEEIRALLAHELGHLVRGDTTWLWIGQALCLCLPFQPLNFLARKRWQSASELLCDDWALDAGVTGLTLARCLAEIAEWNIQRRCRVSLAASGDVDSMVARVQRLVDERRAQDRWKSQAGRWSLAAAMFIGLIGMVLLTPQVAMPVAEGMGAIKRPVLVANPLEDSSAAVSPPVATSEVDSSVSVSVELEQLHADLQRLETLLDAADLDADQRRLARQIQTRYELLRKWKGQLAD